MRINHLEKVEYNHFVANRFRWLASGKSADFFQSKGHIGCPNGKRMCGLCSRGSRGKSMDKGKGKNKNSNKSYDLKN
jgi:hypothetical protein